MGAKEAFCLLKWLSNGGQVTKEGRLDRRTQALGMCRRPYDCFSCWIMQEELARYTPGYVFWACPDCVTTAVRFAREKGIPFHLPGHYTEGQCQYRSCTRSAREEEGILLPPGYSRFLQLVIGPVNH